MLKKITIIILYFLIVLKSSFEAKGQEQDTLLKDQQNFQMQGDEIDDTYNPLILKLSNDGTKYVRILIWGQIWARGVQNNPGTLGVNGAPVNNTYDIGIRRARMLTYASISPRFLILAHWGINNQTFMNGGIPGGGLNGNAGILQSPSNTNTNTIDLRSAKKPQMFFHDFWTEFKVIPEIFIGMGLHYWNGISRLTSAGTLNLLALDAPIFNWPLIELSDQFGRQFGIYAKGQINNWDYRLALNKPFSVGDGGFFDENRQVPVAFNNANDNWASQGYVAYQFLEHENNKLPFFVGSYLGTKKVFNIGAGWHHHPQATSSIDAQGSVNFHDIRLISLDGFLDLPLSKLSGTALTVYSVFYNYDFGPNYIRNIGIMNTGLGTGSTQNGAGNAQPMIGSGNIFFTQAGYLLPKNLFGKFGMLQPYGSISHKKFDFYDEGSTQLSLGLNYFISSHTAKISLEYRQRSYFENYINAGNAGEFIIQTHIAL